MTYPVKRDPYDDTIRCGWCQSLDHTDDACPLKKQVAQEFAGSLLVEAGIAAMGRPRK